MPRKERGVCTVDGCEKPHRAHGFCQMHLKREQHRIRWAAVPALTCARQGCDNQFQPVGKVTARKRFCSPECAYEGGRDSKKGMAAPRVCGWAECARTFSPSRRGDGHAYCSPECQQGAFRAANPDIRRERMLREKYGLTLGEFNAMLKRQHGKCAVCLTTEPGGNGQWSVDHCHESGQVRGILCTRCNTGIGLLGDNPERIMAAARYVQKHCQLKLVI